MKAIGAILLVILVIVVIVAECGRREKYIQSWASDNGYSVVEIKQPSFDRGPFRWDWTNDDDDTFYRVEVVKANGDPPAHRVYWFRFRSSWSDPNIKEQ